LGPSRIVGADEKHFFLSVFMGHGDNPFSVALRLSGEEISSFAEDMAELPVFYQHAYHS